VTWLRADWAALIGGMAGFASIGGGTRVWCASRAPGITPHAVAAVRRSVWATPEARQLGAGRAAHAPFA